MKSSNRSIQFRHISMCEHLYGESFQRFHILFPGAVIDQFKGCLTCVYDFELDDLHTASTGEVRFRLKFYFAHLFYDLIKRFHHIPRVPRGRIRFQCDDQDVSFLSSISLPLSAAVSCTARGTGPYTINTTTMTNRARSTPPIIYLFLSIITNHYILVN